MKKPQRRFKLFLADDTIVLADDVDFPAMHAPSAFRQNPDGSCEVEWIYIQIMRMIDHNPDCKSKAGYRRMLTGVRKHRQAVMEKISGSSTSDIAIPLDTDTNYR